MEVQPDFSSVPIPPVSDDLPLQPIRSPQAWLGPEMARNRGAWTYALNASHIAELRDAIRRVEEAGIDVVDIRAKDFPLPSWETILCRVRDDMFDGRGFALLRGFPVADLSPLQRCLGYFGIGAHFGVATSQNAKGHAVGHVCDIGVDARAVTGRGYQSNFSLPFHSDSSDVVALMCVNKSKSGGLSSLVSSVTLYNEVLRTRPDYLKYLATGLHWDLRGEGPTRDLDEVTKNKLPMFSYFDGVLSVKFNGKTSVAGMKKAGMPLSEEALAAIAYVRDLARSDAFRLDMDFQPGDIQLLCNHSVLHARTGYEDWPEEHRRRRLYRLWVNLPNGRKLAPEFADRTNTGYMAGFHATEDAQYWAGSSKDKIETRKT